MRRASALFEVLILATLLAIGAAAFERSFHGWHKVAVRDPDRARARALLESAWEEARARLVRGEPLGPVEGERPEGTVALRLEPRGDGSRLVIEVRVLRPDKKEWLGRALVVDLVRTDGKLRVVARREVGP